MNRTQETVARLLEGLGRGDRSAVDELFELVYDELKELAHRQRSRWRGRHSMNTTALVHEVYVKVVGRARAGVEDRAHFRALASRAMRHVLCNHARERSALKRGGPHEPLLSDEPVDTRPEGRAEGALSALEAALTELERVRPRAARVVECRFFGGMTVQETALAVAASERSVKRDWALAQAWLHRELELAGAWTGGGDET